MALKDDVAALAVAQKAQAEQMAALMRVLTAQQQPAPTNGKAEVTAPAEKRGPGRPRKTEVAASSAPAAKPAEDVAITLEASVSTETKNVSVGAYRVKTRADGTKVRSEYTYDRMSLAAARALRVMSDAEFEAMIKKAVPYTPAKKAR